MKSLFWYPAWDCYLFAIRRRRYGKVGHGELAINRALQVVRMKDREKSEAMLVWRWQGGGLKKGPTLGLLNLERIYTICIQTKG